MTRLRTTIATVVFACLLQAAVGRGAEPPRKAPPLPLDSSRWVGEPQSWSDLRGQVTLVFVWTFG